jgi:type IV secretion system protein VirB10
MKPDTFNEPNGRNSGTSPGEGRPGSGPGSTEAMQPGTVSQGTVRGERGQPSVSTVRSLQSRVSSIMACGLMIILGAGMLTWYYTSAISRQSRVKQTAQTASARKAQGEMPLPALDEFSAMRTATVDSPHGPADGLPPAVPPVATVTIPAPAPLPELPLAQSRWGASGVAHGMGKSREQLAQERLLSGAAFARESGLRVNTEDSRSEVTGTALAEPTPAGDDLSSLLQPTALASARAKLLPARRFLLSRGAFIDCTLETAIDSTLPGMTTCITASDTFSADGTVVLLERGTKLIGETRGQVRQGVARVFVLWTEARTPTGIVVPLDSPGTDELGRSGLSGDINRHFWERFGAAILISTLDGAVQASVQSASRNGGTVIYNPSGSESVATDVLKDSVNIPPTINERNGDRIQVFVARDVDFRSVYELHANATKR